MTRSRNAVVVSPGRLDRVEATATLGPYEAVVPSISGRAWITSFNQLVLDPTDPFQEGFVVGRPWEPDR
jgi:proline racemase